jgi:hypothetical protein
MDYRNGESGILPFRTGRIFNFDNLWYFAAREGGDFGPFENKADAEVALDSFLKEVISAAYPVSAKGQ